MMTPNPAHSIGEGTGKTLGLWDTAPASRIFSIDREPSAPLRSNEFNTFGEARLDPKSIRAQDDLKKILLPLRPGLTAISVKFWPIG
jgi:hypothetical protein